MFSLSLTLKDGHLHKIYCHSSGGVTAATIGYKAFYADALYHSATLQQPWVALKKRRDRRRDSLCRPTGRPPGPSCACDRRTLARRVVINPLGARILTGIGYIRVHNHQT